MRSVESTPRSFSGCYARMDFENNRIESSCVHVIKLLLLYYKQIWKKYYQIYFLNKLIFITLFLKINTITYKYNLKIN